MDLKNIQCRTFGLPSPSAYTVSLDSSVAREAGQMRWQGAQRGETTCKRSHSLSVPVQVWMSAVMSARRGHFLPHRVSVFAGKAIARAYPGPRSGGQLSQAHATVTLIGTELN